MSPKKLALTARRKPDKCFTKVVREWLKVHCERLKRGKTQKLRICRDPGNATSFVNWPAANDRPVHIALGKGNPCTNPSAVLAE